MEKLTEKQRDLLSKTIVDIGKLVFAALVLAQIVSEKSINAFLFTFGLIVLVVTVIIGLSISTNRDNK